MNDADPADVRQAYAYARVYGVDRAVLAYPGTSAARCLHRDFVVNDGGAPGERTGDGAYVPMTTEP